MLVKLLVGGQNLMAALSTLQRCEDTMLARVFSGQIAVRQKDGAYFIDRLGYLFPVVLECPRDGTAELPDQPQQLRRLLREASFYCLDGLTEIVQFMAPLQTVRMGTEVRVPVAMPLCSHSGIDSRMQFHSGAHRGHRKCTRRVWSGT